MRRDRGDADDLRPARRLTCRARVSGGTMRVAHGACDGESGHGDHEQAVRTPAGGPQVPSRRQRRYPVAVCILALLIALLPALAVDCALAGAPFAPAPTARADASGPAALPLAWTTFLGGKARDGSEGVAVDDADDVDVTGSTNSSDFPAGGGAAQPHFAGGTDAFVAQYTPSGQVRWASYLGGKAEDIGYAVTADRRGNVYVAGETASLDFPVSAGAAQSHYGGGEYDALVASFTADGRLRWATYLGGTGDDDGGGIVVDALGNVYVTGFTTSRDFPVSPRAAQPHFGGGLADAFLASFDTGGRLRWATYLGGTGDDGANGVAVDGAGNAYVTGSTESMDFPVTAGAAQPHYGGGDDMWGDAFVASYAAGGRLRWATYLGGEAGEGGHAIAADAQGTVYVAGIAVPILDAAGSTVLPDFPASPQAAQPHCGGSEDAFLASFDTGGRLRWATYLGGTDNDWANGVAADEQGGAYVVGDTLSTDFPVTAGAAQPQYGGGDDTLGDAFVATYDAGGQMRWATYLGGTGDDSASGVAADRQGGAYVTGETALTQDELVADFPVTAGAAQSLSPGSDDGFLARVVAPRVRPPGLSPTKPPAAGSAHTRYFPQTHHALAGAALAYWDQLGGITTLGLPLSEPFTLAGKRMQATERAVLLLPLGGVRLLPLGSLLGSARATSPLPASPSSASRLYFPSTGHSLSGPFLAYWRAHQGSVLLGAPIAEPDREATGDGTGHTYLVQWFANGRLELHAEAQDPRYQVMQGRVGYEYLHRLGFA